MSPLYKVKRAYERGGAKEVFYSTFRLGLNQLINLKGVSIDENKLLKSEQILKQKSNKLDYYKLPTNQDLSPLQQSESRNPFDELKNEAEFLQSYQYSYHPDFVYELENVRLLGPNGIGITKDGVILEDSITMPRQNRIESSIQASYTHYPLLTMETIYTSRRSSNRTSQTIDCACSLFSGWSNYYHWILEHLPKLRAIDYYKKKLRNDLHSSFQVIHLLIFRKHWNC